MNTSYRSQKGVSLAGVLLGVTAFAVVVAVFAFTRPDADTMMREPSPSFMMEESPEPSAMMKPSPDAMKSPDGMKMSSAIVAEYSQAAYDAAIASGRTVALYFYANWCPICAVEYPKFVAAVGTQDAGKLSAFRVSYNDSETSSEETAAAKTFQVGYQHTLVLVRGGSVLSRSLLSDQTQAQYEDRLEAAL